MAYDIEGQRFHHLLVIKQVGIYEKNGEKIYLCRCDCGNYTKQRSSFIRKGITKEQNGYSRGVVSCGCYFLKMMTELHKTHGNSKSEDPLKASTYAVWNSIFMRCYNKNNPSYYMYGGAGVGVDDRWNTFENFITDAGWKPGDGYDFVLIDKKKDFSPHNTKWQYQTLRNHNRKCNKLTLKKANKIRELYKTGNFTFQQLADKYGVAVPTINSIIHYKLWREL